MRRSFQVIKGWTILGIALLVLVGERQAAFAQVKRLPGEIPRTEVIEGPVKEQIDKFVTETAKILNTGENERAIKDAREALADPGRNPVFSQAFKVYYPGKVVGELKGALSHAKPAVRMNALIVLDDMGSATVADQAIKALADKHAGCRYWAAKVLADVGSIGGALAEQSIYSLNQQKSILAALKTAMTAEKQAQALEQMYRALSVLRLPEADDSMLEVLNKRLSLHAAGADESMRADLAGINGLKTKLVRADAEGKNVDAVVRNLAAVAGKYLLLVAQGLQGGAIGENLKPMALDVVNSCEQVFLELAVKRFDPGMNKPALTKAADANLLLLNTQDWVGDGAKPGLLSTSKIAIPAAQLKLPAGK